MKHAKGTGHGNRAHGVTRRRQVVLALTLVTLVLLLNLLLSLYVWVPARAPLRGLLPLIETLAIAWLVLLIQRRLRSVRARRVSFGLLGAATGLFLGFSAAESFFQFYYARHFLPRSDIEMVRGALLLFFGDIGRTADILTPITIVLILTGLAVVGTVLVGGVGVLVTKTRRPAAPLTLLTLAALPFMILSDTSPSLAGMATLSWFDSPDTAFTRIETTGIETTSNTGDSTAESADGADSATATAAQERYRFPGLKDRDIYMFAVEAYGYATVAREGIAGEIEPVRDAFGSALRSRGYQIRSSYLRSPVAGGYSWLAEATLLTGQLIDSQERFKQLYEVQLPTLTGMLQEGGYYTFTLRPGTVHASWPEGWDLYRFEESVVAHDGDFDYVGPWFSYVPITDQFTLWTAHRRIQELRAPGGAAEDRPLLAYYQLVSSHTPFNRIPPVIQDWESLGNGDIYNRRSDEIRRFDNTWTGGTELKEGYVAAISYVFEVLTDYVERFMDHSGDPIIIVFGDHQAQPPIRGPENIRSVPIHVASRDAEILDLFAEREFQRGMESDAPPPHRDMSEFFPMFAELARQPERREVVSAAGRPGSDTEPDRDGSAPAGQPRQ